MSVLLLCFLGLLLFVLFAGVLGSRSSSTDQSTRDESLEQRKAESRDQIEPDGSTAISANHSVTPLHILTPILDSLGKAYNVSVSSPGTFWIEGEFVSRLVEQSGVLELVDKGKLNIWLSEKNGKVYTFIQYHEGMESRKREFGIFPRFQRRELNELRKFVKEKREKINGGSYPWERRNNINEYYQSSDWKRINSSFFDRADKMNCTCSCCGQDYSKDNLSLMNVHHKITIRNGGDNDPVNLIPLCLACHSLVHGNRYQLLEGLFVHFAKTASPRNEKIEFALKRFDQPYIRSDRITLLETYDAFVRHINGAEAKLFFLNKIEESFRFHSKFQLRFYSECYDRVAAQQENKIFASTCPRLPHWEVLCDLIAEIIPLNQDCERAAHFEKLSENSHPLLQDLRKLKITRNDIAKRRGRLEGILCYRELKSVLAALLYVVRDEPSVVRSDTFPMKPPFPLLSPTDEREVKALRQRNTLYLLTIDIFSGGNNIDPHFVEKDVFEGYDLRLYSNTLIEIRKTVQGITTAGEVEEEYRKLRSILEYKDTSADTNNYDNMKPEESAKDDLPF